VHRCRVIPLVSQEFRRIHNANPPPRKIWDIDRPITQPMVNWLVRIAGSLEELKIRTGTPTPAPFSIYRRMFHAAAAEMPNLQHMQICIQQSIGHTLHMVRNLRQIKSLTLQIEKFSGEVDIEDIAFLAGLQSLEVHFHSFDTTKTPQLMAHSQTTSQNAK